VDGAPVADTSAAIFNGEMFNPIDLDESGAQAADIYAYTGTKIGPPEGVDMTCTDWTSTSSGYATVGYFFSGSPDAIQGALTSCANPAHLYCFGTDYTNPVQPTAPRTGRIAFLSTPVTQSGAAQFDTQCQNEATAAGLPGNYLAAIATTTRTIASRFTVDARPWQRVDGTLIADSAGLFGASGVIPSFVNQQADGTYIGSPTAVWTWTGASPAAMGTIASTCSDWTSTSGLGTVGVPTAAELGSFWATQTQQGCSLSHTVLCLEI
jgi:hypothetical protein